MCVPTRAKTPLTSWVGAHSLYTVKVSVVLVLRLHENWPDSSSRSRVKQSTPPGLLALHLRLNRLAHVEGFSKLLDRHEQNDSSCTAIFSVLSNIAYCVLLGTVTPLFPPSFHPHCEYQRCILCLRHKQSYANSRRVHSLSRTSSSI